MSERGELEVLLPVQWEPSKKERKELVKLAFREARRLCVPYGAKVVGMTSIARAVDPSTGGQAVKIRFAVDAPESVWHHRRSFAT